MWSDVDTEMVKQVNCRDFDIDPSGITVFKVLQESYGTEKKCNLVFDFKEKLELAETFARGLRESFLKIDERPHS